MAEEEENPPPAEEESPPAEEEPAAEEEPPAEEKPKGKNPNYSPSTSLAYIILAGTSGWAIKHTTTDTPWALGTFSFLLGHGLIGALHFINPEELEGVEKAFQYSTDVAKVLPLPLITTELYLVSCMDPKFAYMHAVSPLIPLIYKYTVKDHSDKVVDIILLGNIASLLYLTITKDGAWAGGLVALSVLNHFVFQRISERFSAPKMDIFAVGLSFFNIFAVNCLCEAKFRR